MPDESTILRIRHLPDKHEQLPKVLVLINVGLTRQGLVLMAGTVVGASITAAPHLTKNSTTKRGPEMHQTKKGNQWHFGVKAHLGVDADSSLVHTVLSITANLLHGQEADVFADAGYQAVAKCRAPDKSNAAQGVHRLARASQGPHPRKGGTPLQNYHAAV